jgi:hypothetical protein
MPEEIDGIYLNAYLTEAQISLAHVNKDREVVYVTDWTKDSIGADGRLADFTPAYEVTIGGNTYRRNIVTWEAVEAYGGLGLKYLEDGDTVGAVRSRDLDSDRGADTGYTEGEFSFILGDYVRAEGAMTNFVHGVNSRVLNPLSNVSQAIGNYNVVDTHPQSGIFSGWNNSITNFNVKFVVKDLISADPDPADKRYHDLYLVQAPFVGANETFTTIGELAWWAGDEFVGGNNWLGTKLLAGDIAYVVDQDIYMQYNGSTLVDVTSTNASMNGGEKSQFNTILGGFQNSIFGNLSSANSIIGGNQNKLGSSVMPSVTLGVLYGPSNFLGNIIQPLLSDTFDSAATGTDKIQINTPENYTIGDTVLITEGSGTLPTGISDGAYYSVASGGVDTFDASATVDDNIHVTTITNYSIGDVVTVAAGSGTLPTGLVAGSYTVGTVGVSTITLDGVTITASGTGTCEVISSYITLSGVTITGAGVGTCGSYVINADDYQVNDTVVISAGSGTLPEGLSEGEYTVSEVSAVFIRLAGVNITAAGTGFSDMTLYSSELNNVTYSAIIGSEYSTIDFTDIPTTLPAAAVSRSNMITTSSQSSISGYAPSWSSIVGSVSSHIETPQPPDGAASTNKYLSIYSSQDSTITGGKAITGFSGIYNSDRCHLVFDNDLTFDNAGPSYNGTTISGSWNSSIQNHAYSRIINSTKSHMTSLTTGIVPAVEIEGYNLIESSNECNINNFVRHTVISNAYLCTIEGTERDKQFGGDTGIKYVKINNSMRSSIQGMTQYSTIETSNDATIQGVRALQGPEVAGEIPIFSSISYSRGVALSSGDAFDFVGHDVMIDKSGYSSISHSWGARITEASTFSGISFSDLAKIDSNSQYASINNSWKSDIYANAMSRITHSSGSGIQDTSMYKAVSENLFPSASMPASPPWQISTVSLIYFTIAGSGWASEPDSAGKQIAIYDGENDSWSYETLTPQKNVQFRSDLFVIQKYVGLDTIWNMSSTITNVVNGGTTTVTIMTPNPHGLNSGDFVIISDYVGSYASSYNGQYEITYVDATHFTYDTGYTFGAPDTTNITAEYSINNWLLINNGAVTPSNEFVSKQNSISLGDNVLVNDSMLSSVASGQSNVIFSGKYSSVINGKNNAILGLKYIIMPSTIDSVVSTVVTIATSEAHGLNDGDLVIMTDISADVASPEDASVYNGTFLITLIDATHFSYTTLRVPVNAPASASANARYSLYGGANMIGSGQLNTIFTETGTGQFIGAGYQNAITSSSNSAIVAGKLNVIKTVSQYTNRDDDTVGFQFIGAGESNSIDDTGNSSIVGGLVNGIYSSGGYQFIGGGQGNKIGEPVIRADVSYASIVGGFSNQIKGTGNYQFIGGGFANSVFEAPASTIVGGQFNFISPVPGSLEYASTIVGGHFNLIATITGAFQFIGGGTNNTVDGSGSYRFIGGGKFNQVTGTGDFQFIGGGENNYIDSPEATIVSGRENRVVVTTGGINDLESPGSIIGAGFLNTIYGASAALIGAGAGNTIVDFVAGAQAGAIVAGTDNTMEGASEPSFIGAGSQNSMGTEPLASSAAVSIAGGGSITAGSPGVITFPNPSYPFTRTPVVNDAVRFSSNRMLASGNDRVEYYAFVDGVAATPDMTFYIESVIGNDITLATSIGGPAVDITTGTGSSRFRIMCLHQEVLDLLHLRL